MNKEEVVSATVMTVVSAMVLIGITVAWYTITSSPTVTGLQLMAAEPGTIKIALETGENAKDVTELAKEGIHADIGIDELTNVNVENSTATDDELNGKQKGQMAPGAFGKVTFYLTPTDKSITECDILPVVVLPDANDSETGYYGDEDDETGSIVDSDDGYMVEELFTLTNQHIEFYADDTMTTKITGESPVKVEWGSGELMAEKQIDIYWKWHYEYPFSADESSLTDEEKTAKILAYDMEDAVIGNNISQMRFHFKFGIK